MDREICCENQGLNFFHPIIIVLAVLILLAVVVCIYYQVNKSNANEEGSGNATNNVSSRGSHAKKEGQQPRCVVSDLDKLVELHKSGALTSEEFVQAKGRVLNDARV